MNRATRVLMLLCVLAGCDGGRISGTDQPAPERPVTWVNDVQTQAVPNWGSPVRLNLPVALADIVLGSAGSFGAFGGHQGGHVEGLNHIWIPTRLGIPVRSWAAGTVTKIEDMGSRGTSDGLHEYFVTIDYGQGLIGKHLDVDVPLVMAGNKRGLAGSWLAPDGPGKVVLALGAGSPWYALYTVDEASGRARLTMEWKQGSYPAAITANAAVYTERSPIYLSGDAQALGLSK